MNKCISYHPQAAYDENGVVVNIISFGGHEQNVVDEVILSLGHSGSLSICEMGPIFIGDSWDGENVIRRVDEPAPIPVNSTEDE
jgi:hypothetical protein